MRLPVLSVAAMVTGGGVRPITAQKAEAGTVRGRIVRSADGVPIQGVLVTIRDVEGEHRCSGRRGRKRAGR
jgi:hypothetical protein